MAQCHLLLPRLVMVGVQGSHIEIFFFFLFVFFFFILSLNYSFFGPFVSHQVTRWEFEENPTAEVEQTVYNRSAFFLCSRGLETLGASELLLA